MVFHPSLSDSIIKSIGKNTAQDISALIQPNGAVIFDADGTLWHDDLGDAFFAFLVDKGIVSAQNLSKYKAMERSEPARAYGFAVQCLTGLHDSQVLDLSDKFCRTWLSDRIRQDVVSLARALHDAGMRVEVISATADLIVRPAIRAVLGNRTKSHGIRVESIQGVLTDRLVMPMPFAAGKVDVFNTLGIGPLLIAVGDSMHDIPILRHADLGIWVGIGKSPEDIACWIDA